MPYQRQELRGFRKIAKAFWGEPQAGVIYGHVYVDVSRARRFQEAVKAAHGVWPSMAQLVGRGVAVALTETPDFNAKIIWGRPYVKDTVDVYFQVDVGDGADLSGVTLFDVGNKTPVDVSRELSAIAEKLRKGKDEQYEKTQKGCVARLPAWGIRRLLGLLTFLEYNLGHTPRWLGARPEPFGTVMVTNVSKFGIDVAYAPLISVTRVPFIALVGQVKDRPVVVDGRVVARPVIPLSATFDHRLGDGNKIGRIVRRVVSYMQDPFATDGEALGLEVPEPAAPGQAQGPDGEGATPTFSSLRDPAGGGA